MKIQKVPRKHLADFAVLARRVEMPDLGLQWLRNIVYPENKLKDAATPKELAVYASLLSRVGAVTEALGILGPLEGEPLPEVSLYTAFTHISDWNYEAAIPHLKKYLACNEISEYESLIGRLNLASAYRFTLIQPKRQTALIQEILAATKENDWIFLLLNCLELASQAAIAEKNWAVAEAHLIQAETLANEKKFDGFFLRKWRIVLELRREGPRAKNLEALKLLKVEAEKRRDWETLRECDYYRATGWNDRELALKVYFGSPFLPYRKRFEKNVRDWMHFPSNYAWKIGGPGATRTFDLTEAREKGTEIRLKHGQAMHRFLLILASDFYRPLSVGSIFSRLHPGEYYVPAHAVARIKMTASHLRRWFADNEIPLQIKSEGKSYWLEATAPYDLIVPSAPGVEELQSISREGRLEKLRENWPYKSFSTRQAMELLTIDGVQARELMNWATNSGKVRRIGRGRATLFTFSI